MVVASGSNIRLGGTAPAVSEPKHTAHAQGCDTDREKREIEGGRKVVLKTHPGSVLSRGGAVHGYFRQRAQTAVLTLALLLMMPL